MAVYSWVSAGAVRVTGSDRIPFVHGQTSNDVRGLGTPGACRALILNARGQIEFDVRVFRRTDDLYLCTAGGLGAAVLERLQRYVVFDDVQLEDVSEKLRVVHVSGNDALGVASSLGFDASGNAVQQLETDQAGLVLVERLERGNGVGVDLHVLGSKCAGLEHWLESQGVFELGSLDHARVLAGLADAHVDHFLGMLPQECGLEVAVSYRKGCYIGQEIMARLEARGHTNRHLVRVRTSRALEAGSSITLEGREVGSIGQSVADGGGFLALAVLRKDAVGKLECKGESLQVEMINTEQLI